MALFDPLHRRLVVRVVYDGSAFSGKTTNVMQLCNELPVERRSEVYTPGSLKGRTMFFDWLEIDAGTLGGHPVRCQLLSVPGQTQRSYRRRPLIQSADTVVFVCDSSASQFAESRRSFRLMQRYLKAREPDRVPLVVQANKQDAPDALSPEEIARRLRLPSHVSVIPARARSREGVRETVIAAVRSAVRHTQSRVAEVGLLAIAGAPQSADDLFESMLELEDLAPEENDEASLLTEADSEDDDETNPDPVTSRGSVHSTGETT